MPWTAEAENLISPDGTVYPQANARAATTILGAINEDKPTLAALRQKEAEEWITTHEAATDEAFRLARESMQKADDARRAAKGLQPRR